MTADPRITISFMLSHPPAEPAAVKEVIDKIRLRALDLGFHHVGELVALTTGEAIAESRFGQRPIRPEAVVYFSLTFFDGQTAEIGLCKLPDRIEVAGEAIPYGVENWTWCEVVRTRDVRTLSLLFESAAKIGLWTSMTFAGTTITCFRGASGTVEYQQEFLEVPDLDDF
jgi:hypothetical protein